MKATRLSQFGVCLVLALSAGWLHAEPLLNGLAVSTEFGKERFIAALYADTLTADANEMLTSSGQRRMELKVTADSLSARSVNSMWVEGMAINNPSSALEAEAQNLAKLNNMIRKRLVAGDVLTFDAVPGDGMAVILNGVKLGNINSDDFFPMLLRTWIGSIPLSSGFKDSLLANGDVDAGLVDRYARIEPSDARIEAVAGWVAPPPPAPDNAVVTTSIEPPRPQVAPPQAAPAASDDSSQEEQPDRTAQAPEPEPEPEPEPSVAAAPAAEETPSSNAGQPPEPEEAEPSQPQIARADPAPPTRPNPFAAEPDEEDVEETVVTAESLLMRQRYVTAALRRTQQNMRYPRRALERGQEGSIRLAVTVDRSGEVQDVQVVEDSRYSMLNREALASLERANPFPALPEGVGDETFSFGIPVSFVLQD